MTSDADHASADPVTVLVVEDEAQTADAYASVLEATYEVRVARSGQAALDNLTDAVDVVLLDRRMPGLSGDEVLETIHDRQVDCRVAMVTAVAPDFDIVRMGFDDYLVKPVSAEGLEAAVERLLALDEYDEKQRELGAARVKRNVLQVEKSDAELADSAEFERLEARIRELEAELDALEADHENLPDRT